MCFIILKKEQNNYSKCSAFAFFALLHLFFTSNPVVFVGGEGGAQSARMFLGTPLVREPKISTCTAV